ncbi:hypothetical protein PV08_02173 [Exophiala spinifera]|uniref:Heterokaryon incompatibility domain-containing protein n=1 Tax=Exophiala spinifera TaxID=91928 RepID=A0A0D2BRC1_9EURO|nr:uncharacterized protein PV08_02173 [Exophiala spinifera]KIW21593.1 hypothetical protein PV08_02173 [Exophiala spinifera]
MREYQEESKTVLADLQHLNPLVAKRIHPKARAVSKFVLRFAEVTVGLWKWNDTDLPKTVDFPMAVLQDWRLAQDRHFASHDLHSTSFIAVSYCWHGDSWSTSRSLTDIGGPLTWEMWKAISQLRHSENEGIWLDQLCINQEDEREKQDAFYAMDLVYQSARLVVIVLEDISLSLADLDFLRFVCRLDFDDQSNTFQLLANITRFNEVFDKIWAARCFSRAWCMQEYLNSVESCLLISISEGPHVNAVPFRKLLSAHEVIQLYCPTRLAVADDSSFLLNSMLSRSKNSPLNRVVILFDIELHPSPATFSMREVRAVRNYSQLLARCLAMNARVETDKVAIALNLSGLGVSLDTSGLSVDECCYIFSILTLMRGDWSCLCNTGEFLHARRSLGSPFGLSTSFERPLRHGWLRRPTLASGDVSQLVFPKAGNGYQRLKKGISFVKLHMDMRILSSEWTWNHATTRSKRTAETFARSELCHSIVGFLFKELESSYSYILERCLPAVVDCGSDWLRDLEGQIHSARSSDPLDSIKNQRAEVLSHDYNLDPEDIDKLLEFVLQAVSVLFPNEPESRRQKLSRPLLRLIDFLCYNNIPYIWRLSSKDGRYQAVCGGPFPARLQQNIKIGIPLALLDSTYSLFNRVWVLRPCESGMEVRDKFRALGLGDFQDEAGSVAYFHDEENVTIVGPVDDPNTPRNGDEPPALIASLSRKVMVTLGLSDDEKLKQRLPSTNPGNKDTFHLARSKTKFNWLETNRSSLLLSDLVQMMFGLGLVWVLILVTEIVEQFRQEAEAAQ